MGLRASSTMGTQLELATDWRARGERVSLRVAVELGHGGFEDAFAADSIDLGAGGMAMRAACLPDVGEELACRFRCSPDGEWIDVVGEVVWARVEDEQSCRFGLRFLDLDAHALSVIEQALDGHPLSRSIEQAISPPQHDAVAPPRASSDGYATFEIIGIDAPISARIDSDRGVATFEHTLDDLRLGRPVRGTDGSGREGSIAKVELKLLGNTPMLAVTVDFDGEARFGEAELESSAVSRMDLVVNARADRDTEPDPITSLAPEPKLLSHVTETEFPSPVASPAHVEEPGEEPASEPAEAAFVAPSVIERVAPVADLPAPRIVRDDADDADDATGDDEPVSASDPDAPESEMRGLRLLDQVERATTGEDPNWARPDWTELLPESLGVTLRRAQARARVWGSALVLACSTALVLARRRWLPHLRGAAIRTRSLVGAQLRNVKPGLRATLHVLSELAPRRPRRTTRSAGERDEVEAPRPRLRVPGPWIGALAAALVAAVVGATLLPPELGLAVRGLKPRLFGPTAAAGSSATATAEPAGNAPRKRNAGARADERRRRKAERAAAHGEDAVDPAPLAATAAPPSAGPVPSAEPLPNVEPAPSTTARPITFGEADVPNARRFTLRMTAPVSSLQGARATDGFSVVIPGSLSLDPAGPIGKAHPSVEKALILNRGDRSELTIRFAPGKRPAYRVRGAGATLEILIEGA